ncbi:ETS-related transcription factor Elf-3 isoform X2 [Centrocercus urophasianus]|uniref:ETS-related transcription factor Elf-3 isoform X2 n=2 Tax=Centrocercus urophasianus TaxID=9002 RepID=UPI001C648D41|nr:ETS-related transcription factor Elf-3 isoform X2 [Centrocercus urophasianus]
MPRPHPATAQPHGNQCSTGWGGSAVAVPDGGTEIVGLQWALWVWVSGARAHCHLSSQNLMAASCEISNIFSNYISAMYQPEEVQLPLDVLGCPGEDSSMGLSLSTSQTLAEGTDKPEWFGELPYFWTKVQVLEWISYHVEKNKYDASSIDFSCCNMDGRALCHCTRDQMRLIFGPLGDELYDRLHEITSDELSWIIELLEKEDADSQETSLDSSHLELGNPCAKDSLEDLKPTNPFLATDFTCLSGAMSPGSSDLSGPVMSHSPNSQDSGGSDLDLDPMEAKLFPEDGFAGSKKGDGKHGKRKRGRPRKLSKDSRECLEGRKSKHSPRGTHLWEFIRDILIHPELNEGLMKWEDRREGVFKFLRSEAVAQLWGQKKKNSSMTYEKLSRAMRYYYKREILERVDGRRLVYKFGKNSSGWKEEEVLNRNKEL